jgi:NAD-dependent deacetylase
MDLETIVPLVAFTGAGVSAESGVPTFRGPYGLWENYRPEELATPQAFQRDPELVWRFYKWRRELISNCTPNAAHLLLAKIESTLDDFTLITQNVDGLHELAGSPNVLRLHGSLWRLRCTSCKARWKQRKPLRQTLPKCPECGALARPDVVWFGEALEAAILAKAHDAASRCRTMLVIGTSSLVQPAAQLPRIAKAHGAQIVEMNLERTPLTAVADLSLLGPASSTLQQWWDRLKD